MTSYESNQMTNHQGQQVNQTIFNGVPCVYPTPRLLAPAPTFIQPGINGNAVFIQPQFSHVIGIDNNSTIMRNALLSTPATPQAPITVLQHPYSNRPTAEFLYQLTRMLSDQCNSHIISWSNSRIEVHYPHRLEKEVLMHYFRHSKFASFQRQLNYFGFRKLAGKGKMSPCSYVNDEATNDLRSLLTIKRKSNGTGRRGGRRVYLDTPKETEETKSIDPSVEQKASIDPIFCMKRPCGDVSDDARKKSKHDEILEVASNATAALRESMLNAVELSTSENLVFPVDAESFNVVSNSSLLIDRNYTPCVSDSASSTSSANSSYATMSQQFTNTSCNQVAIPISSGPATKAISSLNGLQTSSSIDLYRNRPSNADLQSFDLSSNFPSTSNVNYIDHEVKQKTPHLPSFTFPSDNALLRQKDIPSLGASNSLINLAMLPTLCSPQNLCALGPNDLNDEEDFLFQSTSG